jgi:hypothetical protein
MVSCMFMRFPISYLVLHKGSVYSRGKNGRTAILHLALNVEKRP